MNKGDRPSRFLVDLIPKEEEKKTTKWEEMRQRFSAQKKEIEKSKKTTPEIVYEEKEDTTNAKNNNSPVPHSERRVAWRAITKDLALISFLIFIIKIVFSVGKTGYSAIYRIGWSAVFLVRFLFILFFKILGIFWIFNKFRSKNKPEKIIEKHEDEILKSFISDIHPLDILEGLDIRDVIRTHTKVIWYKKLFPFRLPSLRPLITFSLILFIIAAPLKGFTYYQNLNGLKGRVLGATEEAAKEFIAAGQSASELNFNEAEAQFKRAGNIFIGAQGEIGKLTGLLNVLGAIIPNREIRLAADAGLILEAGQISSEIGNEFAAAFSSLNKEDKLLKTIIDAFYLHTENASVLGSRLKLVIEKIDPANIPVEHQATFLLLRDKAVIIEASLYELTEILKYMKVFLGFDMDTRYLMVFQNNTELRASGGFIGSFALIDFSNGKIKNLEVPGGGSYDTEGGLKERIIAPEPLHLVNPLWHFWDANWWPDWPTSARKLAWFYEHSGGPTVDGVISLTPTVMERLLGIIGPIDLMEEYGVIIDSKNFWQITQTLSEEKSEDHPDFKPIPYNRETAASSSKFASSSGAVAKEVKLEPKKIIRDLFEEILEVMPGRLNKEVLIKILIAVEDLFKEKQILLYFENSELEEKISEYGLDGRVKDSPHDYLMVVNTNISGGKSDRKIKEEIKLETEILSDGSVINNLEITRTHTGAAGEEFSGVQNANWMRVYVPLGSEFISASGFSNAERLEFEKPDPSWELDPDVAASEGQAIIDNNSFTRIYRENDKTVFANWILIEPGETKTVSLRYKLPFIMEVEEESGYKAKIMELLNSEPRLVMPYTLLLQKQPGSLGSKFRSILKLSPPFRLEWNYPENMSTTPGSWELNGDLSVDRYLAGLLEL